MNKTTTITIVLIVVIVLGWMSAILAPRNKEEAEINAHLGQAEDYVNRELYQKAIEEYDEALALKPDEHIMALKLEAYKNLFEWDDKQFYKKYLQAATDSVHSYPMNVDFQLTLAELHAYKNHYDLAYKSLTKAIENGNEDKRITDYLLKVTYAFKLKSTTFIDYKPYLNDFYPLSKRPEKWYYVNASDLTSDYAYYEFAGRIGEDGIKLILADNKCYLINSKSVIQGFIDFVPEECGVFADGLIPIKHNGKYSYFNIVGDREFEGEYDFAGTFANGNAPVCNNGKWFIIDKTGKAVDDKTYDDIALFQDGTFTKNKVKLLKYSGKYHLINNDQEVGEFDDVDILSDDGYIAVRVNGKWGFVDNNGEMKIEPQYIEARSFSNGLAAVFDGTNWGFVNKNGELAIEYQFPDVGYFDNYGNCMVANYVEEKLTVALDYVVEDGEVISEEVFYYGEAEEETTQQTEETLSGDESKETGDENQTDDTDPSSPTETTKERKGRKTIVVKYKRWQFITLYNKI